MRKMWNTHIEKTDGYKYIECMVFIVVKQKNSLFFQFFTRKKTVLFIFFNS